MKRLSLLTTRIRQIKQTSIKKDILIGAIAGIILTAVFITFQLGRQAVAAGPPLTIPEIARSVSLPQTPLTAESSPEDVIALMLNSHTQWHTLQASAVTLINNDLLDNNSWQTNIQLEQYGKGRGDFGRVGFKPDSTWVSDGDTFRGGFEPGFTWVSDGDTVWQAKLDDKVYSAVPLPEDVKVLENYGPVSPPTEDGQAFVIGHPLAGTLPSHLSSFAFPHGIAQSFQRRTLEVIGSDIVAGRDAVVVLSQVFDDDGTLGKKHEYWVDANTGIILKEQLYAELPLGWDQWYDQTSITEIAYDVSFPSRTFQFNLGSAMKQVSPDEFSNRVNQ